MNSNYDTYNILKELNISKKLNNREVKSTNWKWCKICNINCMINLSYNAYKQNINVGRLLLCSRKEYSNWEVDSSRWMSEEVIIGRAVKKDKNWIVTVIILFILWAVEY